MKSGKTIETAQRALEILKSIMRQGKNVEEILDEITSDKEYGIVYTKEAIYKYLNTFRQAGVQVEKCHGKYVVKNCFSNINLSEEDVLIFELLDNYVKSTKQKVQEEKLNRVKEIIQKNNVDMTSKVSLLNYEKILKLNKKYQKNEDLIVKLEQFCHSKQKIKIKYKNSENNILEHQIIGDKIVFEKGTLLLRAYCIETYSICDFSVEQIENIEPLPQKGHSSFYIKTVVFKVKNKLVKNYKLKEGEIVQEQGEDYMIINNSQQGSEKLIKRLLRYGQNCEILYPKDERVKMANKIDEILSLYKK